MHHHILGNLLRAARLNPAAWHCSIYQPRLMPDGSFNVLPNGNFEYRPVGTGYAIIGAALSVDDYVGTGDNYATEFKLTLIPEPLTGQPLTFPALVTPTILHMDAGQGAKVRPAIISEFIDLRRMLDASAVGLTASFAARKLTEDEAVSLMTQA